MTVPQIQSYGFQQDRGRFSLSQRERVRVRESVTNYLNALTSIFLAFVPFIL
jgi:hypothetical protein